MKKLSAEDVRQLVWGAMTPEKIKEFEKKTSIDFTYAVSGIGRFRLSMPKDTVKRFRNGWRKKDGGS